MMQLNLWKPFVRSFVCFLRRRLLGVVVSSRTNGFLFVLQRPTAKHKANLIDSISFVVTANPIDFH